MKNNLRVIVKGTLLSILLFFSISFLTVLSQLLFTSEPYSLEIGFPFEYYRQFLLRGSDFLNTEWNRTNLWLDCFITWFFATGLYFLKNKWFKTKIKID